MADPAVLFKELTDTFTRAKTYRERKVESRWRDVVHLVVPRYGDLGDYPRWEDRRFNSVGTEDSSLLAEAMFGNLCPSNSEWFRYQFVKEELNSTPAGGEHLEKLTEYMADVFTRSTFYNVVPEYLQIGNSFATATMDIREDKEEERIICTIEHPRSVYCKVNARNEVVESYVINFLTAEQISLEYGEDALTDAMKSEISSLGNSEYKVITCVRRRVTAKPESPLAADWKYGEYVFLLNDDREKMILESGAKELPRVIWRWSVRGNEPYGWGPSDDCMPDIRTCNQMIRTLLLVANKQAEPAKFLPEEGRAWSLDPDATNYYRDPNRRAFKDEISGYRFDYEALQQMETKVRKGMKVDYYLMLQQMEQQMTAREVNERKREALSVVASTVGKFETEALDRIHSRFLQIEADAGRLPDLPQELMSEALRVEYQGPLSQQQKMVAMEQGITNALETALPVFKLWNQTLMKVKPQILIDRIWAANGAPSESLRTDKEYQDALDAAAKAAQAAQQAAVANAQKSQVNPQQTVEPGSPMAPAMTPPAGGGMAPVQTLGSP
jgi:hypothetical protein